MESRLILARRIIFYIGAIFLIWVVAEKALDFNVSGNFPLGFIAVFLYGAHIVLQFATNDIIDIGPGWSVPAGSKDVTERKFGAAVGVFICLLTIYGYFAGWSG